MAVANAAAQPARPARLRDIGIRGRVGVSYQMVAGRDAAAGRISQPALELRVDGYNVGGSPFSFAIDTRGRQTYNTLPDGSTATDQAMRVYQAAVGWNDARSGAHVTLGRQFVSALSSVSLFDGATAELVKQHWSFGAFGGTQPDVVTMGFSNQIREYGGYVQIHQAQTNVLGPDFSRRWSITTGGIGSYDGGQLNREFLFVQAFYSDRRFTLFATQELDYNRGWKRALGNPTIAPTSTFATVQWQLVDQVSFYGGFDNRRNVILYRDYVSPETSFDDSYREGMWAGISLSPMRALRVGGDARLSAGGPYGNADSYTGWLATNFALAGHAAGARDEVHEPDDGRLALRGRGGLSLRSGGCDSSSMAGCARSTIRALWPPIRRSCRRRWSAGSGSTRTSACRAHGICSSQRRGPRAGLESNDQVYASLSYRF